MQVDIFFDFVCPYAYRGALLARWIRQLQPDLQIRWRYFSLVQINAREGADFRIWEQPPEVERNRLLAFKAAEAACLQGEAAFENFLFALFSRRHDRKEDLKREETVLAAARDAGLEVFAFQRHLERGELAKLIADHTEAVERYGIFGTPTFLFAGGAAVFLKMDPLPKSDEEALETWEALRRLACDFPHILEVKRPESEVLARRAAARL